MYRILIDICCMHDCSKILPRDRESFELVIEDLLGLTVLDFFEGVKIEEVRVLCLSPADNKHLLCAFQVQATCAKKIVEASLESLEIRLENVVCCTLLELFSLVMINTISIYNEPISPPAMEMLFC